MVFKFNNGNGAILCSNCGKIMYSGTSISQEMFTAINNEGAESLPDVFCCDACEEEYDRKIQKDK